MAHFAYPPGQNLINMDQSSLYGSKHLNMEQDSIYGDYNMTAIDYKLPVQDNYMVNQYGGYYTQNRSINYVSTEIEDVSIKCKDSVYVESEIQVENVTNLKKKTLQFEKTNGLFYCDICEYSSQKVSSVKSHRMIHTGERPFGCDLCPKTFRQKEHLKNHRIVLHTKEKLFFCNHCKYSCGIRTKMDQHNLIHKGIKPFACTTCDYRCRTPFVMKKHKAKCGSVKTRCETCNKNFLKPGALAIHRLKHLEHLKFSCDFCTYTTKLRLRFKSHLKKEHANEKVHLCLSCNFTSSKRRKLKEHALTHDGRKWFKCDSCEYSSSVKKSLKTHILTHKEDATLEYANSAQNNVSEQNSQGVKHKSIPSEESTSNVISEKAVCQPNQQPVHDNESNLNIYQDAKKDNVISNINQTTIPKESSDTKNVNGLFYCDICNFSSRRRRSVKVHKLLHTGERPFLCDLCPATYTRKHHLLKHRHLHSTAKEGKESKAMKIYTCTVCSFTCAHKASLQRHQVLHSENSQERNQESVASMKKFMCNICKLKYGKEIQLIKHLKKHLEKGNLGGFQCIPDSCKSVLDQFIYFNEFQYNIQQEEILSEQYKDICKKLNNIYHCNRCEFTTKNLISIKVHFLIHTGEKPYKCDMCSASYRRKQHLNNHRSRHLKKTTYLCHLCDFTSEKKTSMELHRVEHEQANVFVCGNCKFSFADRVELEAHEEDCIQLLCSVCAAVFLDLKSLEAHELEHVREKPLPKLDLDVKINLVSTKALDHRTNQIKPELKEDDSLLQEPTIKVETAYSASNFSEIADNRLEDFGHEDDDCDDDKDEDYCVKEGSQNGNLLGDDNTNIGSKKSKSKHKMKQDRVDVKFRRNQVKKLNHMYQCDFCNYSNKRLNSVKVHHMIHTGERPFSCDLCSATFRQKVHLIKHTKTHEPHVKKERNSNTKDVCDKDKSFVCSKCGYRCQWKITLEKHETKCKSAELKCNMCEETFLSQNELVSHRAVHVKRRTYDCELCDFTTGNLLYLKKHTVKHSRMLYLCYVCSFTSVYRSLMQEHRLTHKENSVLKNDSQLNPVQNDCDYLSTEDIPFNLSERNELKVAKYQTVKDPAQNALQPAPLAPSLDPIVPPLHKIKTNRFYGPFCDSQETRTQSGRPKKYKTGEFKRENDLYICDFCDYSNTRVNSVKVHRMIHTDERPFPCDLCPKSFRQKMHLRKHKISHSKEKMFVCGECEFSCRYKPSLDLHKLKHTGVKPYVCDKCLLSYRTQLEMERHVKRC